MSIKVKLYNDEYLEEDEFNNMVIEEDVAVEFLKNWTPTKKNLSDLEGYYLPDFSWSEFAFEEYSFVKFLDWEITLEESYGGSDLGSERWAVFKVVGPDTEKYFKLPGYYQSFYGSEFYTDQICEVERATKTVKYWKEI